MLWRVRVAKTRPNCLKLELEWPLRVGDTDRQDFDIFLHAILMTHPGLDFLLDTQAVTSSRSTVVVKVLCSSSPCPIKSHCHSVVEAKIFSANLKRC